MKKLLTFALILSGAASSYAQSFPGSTHLQQENARAKNFRNYVNFMLSKQDAKAHQKTTGLAERVSAESTYDVLSNLPNNLFDTTKYYYSGDNGSKYDFNSLQFRAYTGWRVEILSYPYDWSLMPVMADSMKLWGKNNSTGSLVPITERTATFNTDKTVAFSSYKHFYIGVPIADRVFIINSYNSQGNISQVLYLSEAGTGFDSLSKTTFHYNSQGRLYRDSVFDYLNNQWLPTGMLNYGYDAAGNISTLTYDAEDSTTSTWMTLLKYKNTFYNDNKIKTSTVSAFNGTQFEGAYKDSIGYASNSSILAYFISYSMNNSVWTPIGFRTQHLNAQGLPDTVITSHYNGFTNSMYEYNMLTYEYTGYGNPQLVKSYFKNGTAWNVRQIKNFYYEIHNDPNNVKTIPAQEEITVYPNPAGNQVNISWKEGRGQKLSFQIVNTAGQNLISASVRLEGESMAIPVEALAPGMYWLIARNEAGAVICKQAILKQ